jgi:hypothetical protein
MAVWIQAPLTGNLNEVPGIGHANQEHLFRQSAEAEKMKGFGAGDCVETTFQVESETDAQSTFDPSKLPPIFMIM